MAGTQERLGSAWTRGSLQHHVLCLAGSVSTGETMPQPVPAPDSLAESAETTPTGQDTEGKESDARLECRHGPQTSTDGHETRTPPLHTASTTPTSRLCSPRGEFTFPLLMSEKTGAFLRSLFYRESRQLWQRVRKEARGVAPRLLSAHCTDRPHSQGRKSRSDAPVPWFMLLRNVEQRREGFRRTKWTRSRDREATQGQV